MAQLPATRRSQGGRVAARREHPLERLVRDFDTLFDRLFGGTPAPFDQDIGAVRLWDFDVAENDRELVVRAELPGFEENEIDVQVTQDALTIKAEKQQKDDRQEEYRSFFRSVTLPPGFDTDNVQATYRNGVLELHIPRAKGSQPKRIAIQGEQAAAGGTGRPAASDQNGPGASPGANRGQSANTQTGAAGAANTGK